MDSFKCVRCDTDTEEATRSALDDGTPNECPHCGFALSKPSDDWLLANGYHLDTED